MRRKLEKRLTYLYTGELVASIMFVLLSIMVNQYYGSLQLSTFAAFWGSLLLLILILLQGSCFWYLKLREMQGKSSFIDKGMRVVLFHKLKKHNVWLFIIILLLFIVEYAVMNKNISDAALFIAAGVYVFSILEYINYYVVQLSYDNSNDFKHLLESKRLKKGVIRRELELESKIQ